MRPLDTFTLGRICHDHDHDAIADRAAVVRGALTLIAGETSNSRVMTACLTLVASAEPETLAKLGRLLK